MTNFHPINFRRQLSRLKSKCAAGCLLWRKAERIEEQIYAYQRLHRFLESYRNTSVLEFDENAAEVFSKLKAQKFRVGTMDLKIASIAISRDAILVSRNLRDFENLPDLVVQDWTK